MQNNLSSGRSDVECDVVRLEASDLLVVLVVDISKDRIFALREGTMLAVVFETLKDSIPVGSAWAIRLP
jgi:hypothetical protein